MTDRAMRICDNKGFHLDLPNGVTVSVQWGPGNYCDPDVSNAGFNAPREAMDGDDHWGSNTAECAAYVTGSNLSWVAVPGFTGPIGDDDHEVYYDDVVGHLDVRGVLDFINLASQLTGNEAKANPKSLGNRLIERLNATDKLNHGDYRDDPQLLEDERKIMDEFQQEEDDEDSA